MRILILALGSTGDVLPCAALGGGLARAGHTVRLASFAAFAPFAERYGLDFSPVSGDPRALVQAGGVNLGRIVSQFMDQARLYGNDFSASELFQTDLVLNQLPGGLFGWDIAEKLRIPMLALAYLPIVPTAHFPQAGFPPLPFPFPAYNRLTYRLAEQMVWMLLKGTVNHWRKNRLGLPPQPPGGQFHRLGSPACPWLLGLSPNFLPPPPDWGPHVHPTGYWYPDPPAWQPPAELVNFIQSGSEPVFIGFGSMPVRDPARVTRLVLEALQRSGQRAVLHAGWGGLGGQTLPEHVFPVDYVPYHWLFPQMSALVIHGGAGATHFALRAGRPTLVVPFLFDQFFWGRQIAARGIGPQPLPFQRLTPERLSAAISQAVSNPHLRDRASQMGSRVRTEPGIPRAVEIIEALYSRA
jgi:sterol 3beta-glucosyltransferase